MAFGFPYKPYVNTYNNQGKVAWNEWCSPERRHGFEHWIAYGTYDNHLKPMYWNTTTPRDSFYYVNQWGLLMKQIEPSNIFKNKREQTAFCFSRFNEPSAYRLRISARQIQGYV